VFEFLSCGASPLMKRNSADKNPTIILTLCKTNSKKKKQKIHHWKKLHFLLGQFLGQFSGAFAVNFRDLPLPTTGKFRPKVPTSNPLVREPLAQVPLGEKRGEWQDVEQRKEKEEEEEEEQQQQKQQQQKINNKNKN